VLKENNVLELNLDNKAQELTMKERKIDLLDFLRSELRNNSIQLETVLVETVSQSKPYTQEEKYKAMLERNPELKTLREALDLELEL
jgi:DNA polymerase-3 subunit gamma/tau